MIAPERETIFSIRPFQVRVSSVEPRMPSASEQGCLWLQQLASSTFAVSVPRSTFMAPLGARSHEVITVGCRGQG